MASYLGTFPRLTRPPPRDSEPQVRGARFSKDELGGTAGLHGDLGGDAPRRCSAHSRAPDHLPNQRERLSLVLCTYAMLREEGHQMLKLQN